MNRGNFYGIGVGPGDPKLLTLKAVEAIRLCDVIAVPEPEKSDRTAYNIVEKYLNDKSILSCEFSMQRNERKRIEQRQNVGNRICEILRSGKSVGFITLGDPMIYSTYGYVLQHVLAQDFEAETIPGVTSFCAAAAALNRTLCEGDESLHILPAGFEVNVQNWVDLPGTKVVMKSGKSMNRILCDLREHGLADETSVVSRCTMPDQRICETLNEYDSDDSGYFSLIIVREKRS